jgi:hypothetical protein
MIKCELNIADFEISEIESIELIGESDTVDITVDDVHMFFANDIYTHNSALNKESFSMDAIGESLGKAATADLIIGLARPDEAKVNNEATFGILKNRNGADGFYLPAIFDTHRIFIDILPPEDAVMMSGGQKSTNKKNEKKTDEDIDNINDILMDNDF